MSAGERLRDPPRLTAAAATVGGVSSLVALVGWSVPGLRGLATWGGVAASSPWTILALLVLAIAAVAASPVRRFLAAIAFGMAIASLVDPEAIGSLQRFFWSGAPARPAVGVDIAIVLLAIATSITAVDVLDGLPTSLSAGAAAVAFLAVFGRLTGQLWLATGGGVRGTGAMSIPAIITILLLAVAIVARDRPRPFLLSSWTSNADRSTVALAAAVTVPLAVAIALPATGPRGPAAYAIIALFVVAVTLVVQLASVATQHRDALATVVEMVESSPDATLMVDADGRVVTANATAAATFGTSRDGLVGTAIGTLVPPEQYDLSDGEWTEHRPVSAPGSPGRGARVVARRSDSSEFPAEVWWSPLRLRRQQVTAAVVRDVTAHTLQIERLREIQRMQEVFAMAISHELRTPLTVISGMAETLLAHGERMDADRRRELLERLLVHAQRISDMTADLLDVQRLRRGMEPPAAPVDTGRLIAQQVRQTATDRGLDVTVTIASDVPPIRVDPVLLLRVVDNLLINAAKYAPGPIEVHVTRLDDGMLLTVDDHGAGVPEGLREEIFHPFRRGEQIDSATPGVGVGLALMAGLAASTGGRAWVQERDDARSGASFRLHVPTWTSSEARAPDPRADPAAAP